MRYTNRLLLLPLLFPILTVPIPTDTVSIRIRIPACLSVFCFNFCPLDPSPITSFGFAYYYFSSLSILYVVFLFSDKGTVIKTPVQLSDHSSSAT